MGILSRTLLGGAVGSGMGYLLSPEEQKIEGAIAGGLGGAGGGLLSRFVMIDPTKLGTFGGSLGARNLASKGVVGPQQALIMAEEMAARGASRDEIWDATAKHLDGTPYAGVFKGVDGKWRFEIDDSGAKLTGVKRGPLGAVLEHPKLYDAYPDMANITTIRGGKGGAHVEPSKINDEMVQFSGMGQGARSIALHEAAGHGVQLREGFARGGSPKSIGYTDAVAAQDAALEAADVAVFASLMERYPNVYRARDAMEAMPGMAAYRADAARRLWEESGGISAADAQEIAASKARQAAASYDKSPYQMYNDLAGEVEARNVQTRRDFTPAERRAKRPWETQDVPDDQQIVRFGAGK